MVVSAKLVINVQSLQRHPDRACDERAQSEITLLAQLAKSRVALSCSRNVVLRVDRQPAEGDALARDR
jgi:hypothetical protein